MAWRDGPTRITGERVSAGVFEMLRVGPAIGRTFERHEEAPGSSAVIILSWAAWHRYFNGDADVLGRVMSLDGSGYSVIGVMPRDFRFLDAQAAFWIPFAWPADARSSASARSIARIGDDVSMAAATSEVRTMMHQLRGTGTTASDSRFELLRIRDELSEPVRPAVRVLAGARAAIPPGRSPRREP